VTNVFISNLNIQNKTTFLKNTASFSSVPIGFGALHPSEEMELCTSP
jgi:hypothetical protein